MIPITSNPRRAGSRGPLPGTRVLDMTGFFFGRLTVIGPAGKTKHGLVKWRVRCECGEENVTKGSALRSGQKYACASCLHRLCGAMGGREKARRRA